MRERKSQSDTLNVTLPSDWAIAFQATLLFGALFKDLELSDRDFGTLINRVTNEGYSFLVKTLPQLAKALESGIATGQFNCPTSFKRAKSDSALPAFLGSLFRAVFTVSGKLLDEAQPQAVRAIRQVCYLYYKADFPYTDEQRKSVTDRFVSTEAELANLNISKDETLRVASALVSLITDGYSSDSIVGGHGPGVTANVEISQKYEHALTPLPVVAKFMDKYFFNQEDMVTRLDRYPTYGHFDLFKPRDPVAKVLLVNKDARGPRLISCEPAENMFIQQGIKDFLYKAIEGHALTKGHVNFKSQSVNQEMSRIGSQNLKWSTLDLKDASDRVHLDLVRILFAGNPQLLDDLLITRSGHTVLPDGQLVKLSKFAPMGSALCFPVMALTIFVLLASRAVLRGYKPEDAFGSIYVYGDDIIVPTQWAPWCITTLERYGLKVNVDKSFVGSRFTESCGTDWFDGFNVSPVRMRECIESQNQIQNPRVLVSLTMTANLFAQANYPNTAEHLYRLVESSCGQLPYGFCHSPYLCRWLSTSDRWTNQPSKIRTRTVTDENGNTKVFYKMPWVKTQSQRFRETPYGRLARTHRTWGTGVKPDPFGSMPRRRDISIVYRWTESIVTSRFKASRYEVPKGLVDFSKLSEYEANSRFAAFEN